MNLREKIKEKTIKNIVLNEEETKLFWMKDLIEDKNKINDNLHNMRIRKRLLLSDLNSLNTNDLYFVLSYKNLLKFVNKGIKYQRFAYEKVSENSNILYFIDFKKIKYIDDLVRIAIANNPYIIKSINPKDVFDYQSLAIDAIETDPYVMELLDEEDVPYIKK